MTVSRRLVLLAAVLFTAAAAIVECRNLYPACGGIEHQANVAANQSGLLFKFPDALSGVSLNCLSYDVTNVKGGQNGESKDFCEIAHQTEYAYRLVLRAVYTDKDGSKVVHDHDIRDFIGGTITQLKLRLPAKSGLSIVLINNATDKRCTLKARMILSFAPIVGVNVSGQNIPVLVAADPPTIYSGRNRMSHLILRHPNEKAAAAAADDCVFLVNAINTCANEERKQMQHSQRLPANVTVSEADSRLYTSQGRFFDENDPGAYRLCYLLKGPTPPVEMAVINVFGGNPAYYEIISGQLPDGRILLGTPVTMKFYGHDLDTRQNGDSAKFVLDEDDCTTGKAAGGVPIATDLGPEDDYGPGTTYTLWTWTLREGGSFKVCYKRKKAETWTEVPSIDVVGPRASTEDPSAGPFPIPTDPTSKEQCATAPNATLEAPWIPYKSVKIELEEKALSNKVFSLFEKVLCVPRSALTMMHVPSSSAGVKVVYVSIFCEEAADGKTPACSSIERYNYIAYLHQQKNDRLREHGIVQMVPSVSMFAIDDNTVRKGGIATTLIWSIAMVCSAALLSYGVIKYKERREYLVQFGVDEADIDDMYNLPTEPAQHYEFNNQGGHGAVPIGDALIELED